MPAACSIQTILDDNPCLFATPTYFLEVAIVTAWCGVNGNVGPVEERGQWWNPGVGGWNVGGSPVVNPELA